MLVSVQDVNCTCLDSQVNVVVASKAILHCHAVEWQICPNSHPYDILIENTGPQLWETRLIPTVPLALL